ncbi:MAG: Ig-like domain-containing protein [Gemmatimonadaceae bacterium]|nr:Ig-like domain-containing protein [Gemmatimonadaceae bacterium]
MNQCRIVRWTTLIILAFSTACGGEATTRQETLPPVSALSIESAPDAMVVGAIAQLAVRVAGANGQTLSGRSVVWSSAGGVVAVSAGGLVTAVQPGIGTVSVSCEGQTASATIRVTPKPIAQLTVTPSEQQLMVGTSFTPTAVALDDSGKVLSGRTFVWSTENAATATVSAGGTVSAVAPGTTRVTAGAEGRTASVVVRVIPIPVAALTIPTPALTLITGQTVTLTAIPRDSLGRALTGRLVTWSSCVPSVASISTGGVVTGVSPGAASITATSEGVSASIPVTVQLPPVASMTITPTSLRMPVGTNASFTATLRDAGGIVLTDRPIAWTVDNPVIATISTSGVVTALVSGSTAVRASVEGRSVTANLTVLIPEVTVQVSPATASLAPGQSLQLLASVHDAITGITLTRPVTWRASSPSVASVNATGLVTALAYGTTVVEATSDARTSASTIRVEPQSASIGLVTGNGQTAPVRTSVPVSPTVVVKDGAGRAVPGVTVTFDVIENTGLVIGSTDVTDANGEASAASWILGATAGSNKLRASVGLSTVTGSPVVFTATGTPTTSTGTTTCCKRCTTGKPCGDSCIALSSTCRTLGGCACYGSNTWSEAILGVRLASVEAPWRRETEPTVPISFFPFHAIWSFGCFDDFLQTVDLSSRA